MKPHSPKSVIPSAAARLALSCALTALAFAAGPVLAQPAGPVALNWLDGRPPEIAQGVSWGVPWPKGKVQPNDAISLRTADGKDVPMQTWTTAYWPDGSVMWSGHSITAAPDQAGPLSLAVAPGAGPAVRVVCREDSTGIDIDTGAVQARIPRQGSSLIESLTAGGRRIAGDCRLVLMLEDRSEYATRRSVREEDFVSRIKTVTLEQSGPVRAVVKIEGDHKSTASDREWLPFVVRFYFSAGLGSIRVVHSIVYDGDVQKDFIKGLGLSIDVPLREEVINRHVRFGGDTGMWAEPVKPMVGRRDITYNTGRGSGPPVMSTDEHAQGQAMVFPDQVAGRRVPNTDQYTSAQQKYIRDIAQWDDYRLTQLSSNGFTIQKRTQDKSSWLHVLDGRRSLGLAFLGDVQGGVAVDLKNFWQKNPSSLEIHGATTPMGRITVWMWSPEAQPMDLRHYDIVGHGLDMAYEDWKEGWDNAYGEANTSELTLWALPEIPSDGQLAGMARAAAKPAMLVCTPQYYHDQRAFGFWSLPDRSTPFKSRIEDRLANALEFYRQEVDYRTWYGFWDYGDMMRMYDEVRHEWRYDIGGWAWTNTELLPDYWLWYSFLRTGRADIFRLAEAMTRNTSEVSVHHIGRFAPLGSRHNVNHLGDGAKQPRVSQSGLKRFYYFLTTDERIGDLMHEQLPADFTYAEVKRTDPNHPDNSGQFTGMGWLDWAAYCNNWLTEYERTRDPQWLDKIKAGMESQLELGKATGRLLSLGAYDPKTGRFMPQPEGSRRGRRGARGGPESAAPAGEEGGPAPGGRGGVQTGGPAGFDLLFGTMEAMSEMELYVDNPQYWEVFHRSVANQTDQPLAYAAYIYKDPEMGARVWQDMTGRGGRRGRGGRGDPYDAKPALLTGPDVPNPLQEVAGRPQAAGDGHRLRVLIEELEWAGQWAPTN
ncbi:MAG: hypothetical protein ABSA05_09945 [Opitutaceae bacterium]|jgi:hypothetical protein